MVFAALVGGLVGARGYRLLGNLDELSDDPLDAIVGGSGRVWYGGALGGGVGVALWARRRGMLNLQLLDLCSPALAMGYAVGRVGCQISGDGDYGEPTGLPWGMAYPDGVVPTNEVVHPTPIYETLVMGIGAWVLWRLRDVLRPGVLFACRRGPCGSCAPRAAADCARAAGRCLERSLGGVWWPCCGQGCKGPRDPRADGGAQREVPRACTGDRRPRRPRPPAGRASAATA